MLNEIFSFIDGDTIARKMILLNKRMHDEILTVLGPIQDSRVISVSSRPVYSLMDVNGISFIDAASIILKKVCRYSNTVLIVEKYKE